MEEAGGAGQVQGGTAGMIRGVEWSLVMGEPGEDQGPVANGGDVGEGDIEGVADMGQRDFALRKLVEGSEKFGFGLGQGELVEGQGGMGM